MPMIRVLVTGGAGYIGSVCVEELHNQGYSVVVVDNLKEGHREALIPEAVFYEGNFGDRALLSDIFGGHKIDAVIHFAAETTVEFSMTDPQLYFVNNLVQSIHLLEAMKKYGCRDIIFSSTAATFGEPEYIPIDEKHVQKPINAYGESKLMFEKVLDWYHFAYGLRFNVFRYFNAAGASARLGEDHAKETHLIPIILKAAHNVKTRKSFGRSFKVFGNDYPTIDGTCVRDYIHVVDLAKAHILSLKNLDTYPNAKYNLGNGEGFSILQVIEVAKKVTGVDIPYEFAGRRAGDPATLVASSEKIRQETGWAPLYPDLESIIKTAWDWHEKHPGGYSGEVR